MSNLFLTQPDELNKINIPIESGIFNYKIFKIYFWPSRTGND